MRVLCFRPGQTAITACSSNSRHATFGTVAFNGTVDTIGKVYWLLADQVRLMS
ncbi:MAG: hypothetical protein JNM18_22770 [Planctomycetaceae bacterium]|nr:hypothetical protein [Planctomycetaceae bacterium]